MIEDRVEDLLQNDKITNPQIEESSQTGYDHANNVTHQEVRSHSTTVNSNISYIHNIGTEPLKPITIGQLLEQTAQKFADVPAIISRHQNRTLTFRQVVEEADKLAAGMKKLGLQTGDRVGIWAPNLIEWYISFVACARLGVPSVTINSVYQAKEMEFCINKVEIKILICTLSFKYQNYYGVLNRIIPDLGENNPKNLKCERVPSLKNILMIAEETLPGTLKFTDILNLATPEEVEEIKNFQDFIKMDAPSNIQFTSGTTGSPKAVVMSHFQLVNNSYLLGKRGDFHLKQHRICVQVPLFHVFGVVGAILTSLNYGITLVLPSVAFDPVTSLEAIKEEKCTIIYGTPSMYVDLLKAYTTSEDTLPPCLAFTGGALCSPQLIKDMISVLNVTKVSSFYGMTETTGTLFQSRSDDEGDKVTLTVGYVSEHIEAKVVDQDGNIVPRGTPGELMVRGFSTMLEYWGDPEKSREVLGKDKWLRTGDQFVLQEDGYGRVVGRLKELIIRGGENIFPGEIEDFLNTHPDIIETHVRVIGLRHERLGEEVCACIRVKEGITVTLENIKAFCKGNIAYFKIPSVLRIVESFPKTASGKIQKFKLMEMFRQ